MVWGQGDGSRQSAVDSEVGRIGTLACWEHDNPLVRYASMADGDRSPKAHVRSPSRSLPRSSKASS